MDGLRKTSKFPKYLENFAKLNVVCKSMKNYVWFLRYLKKTLYKTCSTVLVLPNIFIG